MDHSAKKGNCSSCKVCKAYLRAAGRNQVKKEAIFTEGETPAAGSPAEKVVAVDLPDAEELEQTEGESSGCPEAESPE